MMRRSLAGILGAAAVAAVVTTGFVHAQAQDGAGAPPPQHERRGPGGPGGPGGFFGGPDGFGRGGFGGPMALLRQLDLTDDQRAQVRQVMESHRDEQRAIGERVMAAHRAQDDAVTAAQFDEQAVRSQGRRTGRGRSRRGGAAREGAQRGVRGADAGAAGQGRGAQGAARGAGAAVPGARS